MDSRKIRISYMYICLLFMTQVPFHHWIHERHIGLCSLEV